METSKLCGDSHSGGRREICPPENVSATTVMGILPEPLLVPFLPHLSSLQSSMFYMNGDDVNDSKVSFVMLFNSH